MAKRKTRRRFSEEFKAETVKLVKQSNRSMAELAMELGISAKSIGEMVHKAEENGQSIDEDERVSSDGSARRIPSSAWSARF